MMRGAHARDSPSLLETGTRLGVLVARDAGFEAPPRVYLGASVLW